MMGLIEPGQALITRRSFCTPLDTACDAELLGGDINPTPGGKMPGESHCSPREIQTFLNHVPDPLLDRIELRIEARAVKFQDLTRQRNGEDEALGDLASARSSDVTPGRTRGYLGTANTRSL